MRIGFTGTQYGMTAIQKERVEAILREHPDAEFHHGCCIGADAEAHAIARRLQLRIVLHPPTDPKKMDPHLFGAYERLPPLPYHDRNRAIVRASDVLIVAPKTRKERRRSGTWSTWRRALRTGVQVRMVYPD